MTDYEDDDEYEDDLDLRTLPDDELVEQMHDDLYNGLKEEVAEGTEILLERGWDANKVLNEALVAGMTIVGIDFRDGILFVPEVLMSANAMKAGMAILKPLLSQSDEPTAGSKSSISASTRRSRSTWPRSKSTSRKSSACRRC